MRNPHVSLVLDSDSLDNEETDLDAVAFPIVLSAALLLATLSQVLH